MKRLIILMCTVSALMVAQDAAGSYKLTGVDVLYTYITREAVDLTVTDAYGFGITQAVASIPAAAPFNSQAMQLTDAALSAVGINLNVTLNVDGSGSIAEGSYYPDVNTIMVDGNCVTVQQVLPVLRQMPSPPPSKTVAGAPQHMAGRTLDSYAPTTLNSICQFRLKRWMRQR